MLVIQDFQPRYSGLSTALFRAFNRLDHSPIRIKYVRGLEILTWFETIYTRPEGVPEALALFFRTEVTSSLKQQYCPEFIGLHQNSNGFENVV